MTVSESCSKKPLVKTASFSDLPNDQGKLIHPAESPFPCGLKQMSCKVSPSSDNLQPVWRALPPASRVSGNRCYCLKEYKSDTPSAKYQSC